MNKLPHVLMSTLMLSLPAPLLAQVPTGIVAHTIGSYTIDVGCAGRGCTGELVTCRAGQALVTAKMIYLFMEGVCDDAGPTPCNRRLRGLLQNCLDPRTGLNKLGSILSITMQGRFRFCFDDTAESDCTGTPPEGIVVGEGINRMQGRHLVGATAPMQASDELILTETQNFTIDGKRTRIRSTLTVYDSALEPPAKCWRKGCGLAGTAVSHRLGSRGARPQR